MLSQWYLIYVTKHEQIGLTYSKHFGHFLDFCTHKPYFLMPGHIWSELYLERFSVKASYFKILV